MDCEGEMERRHVTEALKRILRPGLTIFGQILESKADRCYVQLLVTERVEGWTKIRDISAMVACAIGFKPGCQSSVRFIGVGTDPVKRVVEELSERLYEDPDALKWWRI